MNTDYELKYTLRAIAVELHEINNTLKELVLTLGGTNNDRVR